MLQSETPFIFQISLWKLLTKNVLPTEDVPTADAPVSRAPVSAPSCGEEAVLGARV